MKKFDFDKKFKQIAILAFLVIIGAITFEKTIGNLPLVWEKLKVIISFIGNLLFPFVIGFAVAYLLNPGLRFVEKKIEKNGKFKFKARRIISILIVYLVFSISLIVVITSIIPSVIESTASLISVLPSNIEKLDKEMEIFMNNNEESVTLISSLIAIISPENLTLGDVMTYVFRPINSLINNLPELVGTILVSTISIAGFIFNIILGFVISVYMLYDKEYFSSIGKRFLYAIFKKRTANATMTVLSLSNHTFERFIVGKSIDSIIIGILFFIICLFLDISYAPLLAIIIGITNMIPYFGPFIGAVPVLLIVALIDIHNVLPVALSILALQQFDGIILGPKILGDSIGIKPISIILAIMVGGGLFGPIGMFLGAPVFAVLATMVTEVINQLEKLQIIKESEENEESKE